MTEQVTLACQEPGCGKTLSITVWPDFNEDETVSAEAWDEGWLEQEDGWYCNEHSDDREDR